MNNLQKEASLQSTSGGPTDRLTQLEQQAARWRVKVSQELTRAEKRLQRAHYLAGEIILRNRRDFASVFPLMEPYLHQLGSARAAVDEYEKNLSEVQRLRDLLKS